MLLYICILFISFSLSCGINFSKDVNKVLEQLNEGKGFFSPVRSELNLLTNLLTLYKELWLWKNNYDPYTKLPAEETTEDDLAEKRFLFYDKYKCIQEKIFSNIHEFKNLQNMIKIINKKTLFIKYVFIYFQFMIQPLINIEINLLSKEECFSYDVSEIFGIKKEHKVFYYDNPRFLKFKEVGKYCRIVTNIEYVFHCFQTIILICNVCNDKLTSNKNLKFLIDAESDKENQISEVYFVITQDCMINLLEKQLTDISEQIIKNDNFADNQKFPCFEAVRYLYTNSQLLYDFQISYIYFVFEYYFKMSKTEEHYLKLFLNNFEKIVTELCELLYKKEKMNYWNIFSFGKNCHALMWDCIAFNNLFEIIVEE